ncbi:Ig-like domain-containing protein [Rosettibacter firmus]|uniref:Ig-like domain-containing protein n=1 Tax=Rosettibacter firmus TaxID=3111522 RepID=UPI00336BD246
MKFYTILFAFLFFSVINAQNNRIRYNNQDLFLSGTNLAWLSFARDIGTGSTDFNTFADIFLTIHENGGNVVRWWLHTDGTATPQFDNSGYVVGPGVTTISDLKKVLDLAWEREIGVILTLWSFDMLRSNKSATVLERNRKLLLDTNYTRSYINNSLIPMVDSLKGHPAIVAWEIFNEPEGMSNEYGWPEIQHVPMSAIQRFVNLCAGAIHRTDPAAKVTNGSWHIQVLTDITPPQLTKLSAEYAYMSDIDKKDMENRFYKKYGFYLTADQIIKHYEKVMSIQNYNYYTDERLIATGGDKDGKLDFYTFHYYDWAGKNYSPFHRPASIWALDKPLVVAEFHVKETFGVPKDYLYVTLYNYGYAGALAWSWTDNQVTNVNDILKNLKFMWDNYKNDVDIIGIGGDWPVVTLTNPANNSQFPEGASIQVEATAYDNDGSIALVEFFANDTLKIGEDSTEPYSITWSNVKSGIYKLTAVAIDNQGHKRTSNKVEITVGTPQFIRLEAEAASKQGNGITVIADKSASKGFCVDARTQTGTITWTLQNVPVAGKYEIRFGYKLAYDTPKGQYINVNGVRVAELMFDGPTNVWLEKELMVDLVQGKNTIQMELFWGWMQIDYLAVPSILVTSVETITGIPNSFSLSQNYPNPFNPSTVIDYQIPVQSKVDLKVYDILGREVAVLVDEIQNPGNYRVTFNASNLSSGVYYYRLKANNYSESKKMILLK